MPGVPITITKIEGDKIIIIKKIIVPKNSKIPEQYLQVGRRRVGDRLVVSVVRLVFGVSFLLCFVRNLFYRIYLDGRNTLIHLGIVMGCKIRKCNGLIV